MVLDEFKCTRCSELIENRHNIVIYRGNRNSKMLLIGEAPGKDEDLQGKPFVGKSGKFLDKFLVKLGINPEKDICIINTLRCRPPDNRDPSPGELFNCKEFAIEFINTMKPDTIITLGKVAREWMINNWFLTIQEEKELCFLGGGLYWPEMNKPIKISKDVTFLPVYHPRYLMSNKEAAYKAYLAIKELLNGGQNNEKHNLN